MVLPVDFCRRRGRQSCWMVGIHMTVICCIEREHMAKDVTPSACYIHLSVTTVILVLNTGMGMGSTAEPEILHQK